MYTHIDGRELPTIERVLKQIFKGSGQSRAVDSPDVDAFVANHGWLWVDPSPPPEPTSEEIQQSIVFAVQAELDRVAKTRNYDNIQSLCTYAASTDTVFVAEAAAGIAYRDGAWRTCYNILEDVVNGIRPTPTSEEVILEIPTIIWP